LAPELCDGYKPRLERKEKKAMNPDLITALNAAFTKFEGTLTQTASDTNTLNGLQQTDADAKAAIVAAQAKVDAAVQNQLATADALSKQLAAITTDNVQTGQAAKELSDAALAISVALAPPAVVPPAPAPAQ
jgi:hypothetical protein